MGFKVNHYAAKTINRTFSTDWETLIIELIIGGICAVLAVVGYKANLLLVFGPAGLISAICFLGITYNLYQYWQDKRHSAKGD
ncbi:hypothetical protein ABMY44_04375 [Pseudoalteromonas sp. Cnat2-41]|uniref:hypothetical protein n=1 Tax=unclassified Pseudoalteromonas TaxID=194690 RepID=UPI001EF7E60A|nr:MULTISPECIES: hypothetical protein [unclassified Pseudoalteromonas]MCF2861393.1 hypothetical protein [Pseudoalteromonas sp. CNAT2-18]MCG7557568.1 hypothetical protein [Pseudoalteromonas sp. CNAT2-18.1]